MTCPDFSEASLRSLLETICDRTCSFMEDELVNPIYLRFDIDDNIDKARRMAHLCSDHGCFGTFFILNTARYWTYPGAFEIMRYIQRLGHEIAWHNNILTQMINWNKQEVASFENQEFYLDGMIKAILGAFATHGLTIRGSASHGDPLCHQLGYINYEVFKECPRTQEAANFPKPSFTIPQVSMHDFGLEYEAYHVPYDLYLSESGGRGWIARETLSDNMRGVTGDITMPDIIRYIPDYDRIQILIHPQHWKI